MPRLRPEDVIEACLNAANLEVGGDGGVALLHASSADGATAIIESGVLIAGPGQSEVFVATSPTIAADLSLDVIVPVRIRVDLLRISKRWQGENVEDPSLVRWEFGIAGTRHEPLAVGHRAYYDAETNAGPGAEWLLRDD
jgi:hypothetical protein